MYKQTNKRQPICQHGFRGPPEQVKRPTQFSPLARRNAGKKAAHPQTYNGHSPARCCPYRSIILKNPCLCLVLFSFLDGRPMPRSRTFFFLRKKVQEASRTCVLLLNCISVTKSFDDATSAFLIVEQPSCNHFLILLETSSSSPSSFCNESKEEEAKKHPPHMTPSQSRGGFRQKRQRREEISQQRLTCLRPFPHTPHTYDYLLL